MVQPRRTEWLRAAAAAPASVGCPTFHPTRVVETQPLCMIQQPHRGVPSGSARDTRRAQRAQAALSYPCPAQRCGAQPGQPCLRTNRTVKHDCHPERRALVPAPAAAPPPPRPDGPPPTRRQLGMIRALCQSAGLAPLSSATLPATRADASALIEYLLGQVPADWRTRPRGWAHSNRGVVLQTGRGRP